MAYYPIFLELKGRPCLIIGAGAVAYQKAKTLIACGAKLSVVSPTMGEGIRELLKQGALRWKRHSFTPQDLDGVELVVAATDDQKVNEEVFRLARKKKIWVNVVDQPALCSFIVPSVVRRGKLVLAISTGGISPALAKWIRKDLESRYGFEFGKLLKAMARVRNEVKRKVPGVARRKRVFEEALAAYFKVLEDETSLRGA